MVSKEVSMDLKKYKMTAGTSSKAKRSKSKGDGEDSPTRVRFEDQARGHRNRGRSNDARGCVEEAAFHSQAKKLLRDLDTGVAEKITLMQMLVHKCDEADQNINRLQNAINNGSMETVER